ncbi:MAG: N-acetyl-alpha-D-glucosaminyl L-malate synthase BshA [Terriglobales bacterium]
MKIGITCYPTYGGSGVVATELGIELAQRGHEVHFITYSPPFRLHGTQEPNIHYHEVEVSNYPLFDYPPYDLALATRMAEVAEIYELDLLHVHYAIPHSVSALLARQMLEKFNRRRLPFVTTLHGTDITLVGADRSYLPITRFSIEQSDGVTAISHYLRERTIQEFEIRHPIQVIWNFVNCDIYQRDIGAKRRRLEFANEDERLLVHLSNFRPVKRLTDVIEIFDRVQQKVPAKLLLIGDGPDRSKAEWLAFKKGIHKSVIFMGKQDRVHEKLAMADVMLLPSQLESFGLAALEAMACEVVPIATRVGGVPEVIDHGENGFLAEVGDVDAMAAYAVELLGDESRLRAMGKACRKHARARFCASNIIPEYEKYYQCILGRS